MVISSSQAPQRQSPLPPPNQNTYLSVTSIPSTRHHGTKWEQTKTSLLTVTYKPTSTKQPLWSLSFAFRLPGLEQHTSPLEEPFWEAMLVSASLFSAFLARLPFFSFSGFSGSG